MKNITISKEIFKDKNFQKFIYMIGLITLGLILIFSTAAAGYSINAPQLPWSPKGKMSSPVHFIFLALPWILLGIIFAFRRKFNAIPMEIKQYIYITMGVFIIMWELAFDVASIYNRMKIDHNDRNYAMFKEFIGGFDYCRMNMYIVGTLLTLRRIEILKWVAATALFGGYSTLIDHYHDSAPMHSLMTHTVILATFPALAIAMDGSNYKVKNLIHSHLFNWTLVIIMIMVNTNINGGWEEPKSGFASVAGELTKNRMLDNSLVGWAGWPFAMFLWIFAVMALEWTYFIIHRLIVWRTYDKESTFKETFTNELKIDLPTWFGLRNVLDKEWRNDSFKKVTFRYEAK